MIHTVEIFEIPDIGRFKAPRMNADQFDSLLANFPALVNAAESKGFNTLEIDFVGMLLSLEKIRPLRQILATLLIAENETYWTPEKLDDKEWGKLCGRIPIEYIMISGAEGQVEPGIVMQNFFTSNERWGRAFAALIGSWSLLRLIVEPAQRSVAPDGQSPTTL